MDHKVIKNIYIYPTSTVWGIGSDFLDDQANQSIKNIKKSSILKPMSLMIDSFEHFKEISTFDVNEYVMLEKLFFFKTTILFQIERIHLPLSKVIIGESKYVGFRIFRQPIEQLINDNILKNSFIITTTSLNMTGESPITNYKEAVSYNKNQINNQAYILDLKVENSNIPSTILKYVNNKLLIIRKGDLFEPICDQFKIFTA